MWLLNPSQREDPDTLWRKQRVCMNLFIWLLLTALPLGERRLLTLYAWLYLHYSGMASWCISQSPAQVCPHVWARLQDNWTLLLPSLTLFPAWLQGPIPLCTLYEIPLWAVKSKKQRLESYATKSETSKSLAVSRNGVHKSYEQNPEQSPTPNILYPKDVRIWKRPM